MGAILCCLRGPDDEDDAPGCFPCLPWPFLINDRSSGPGAAAPPGAYARVAPVPHEGSTGSGSGQEEDPMSSFRSPPMPLPYDDPRFRQHTEKSNLLGGESSDADARSATCADEKDDGDDGPSLKAQLGAQVHVPCDCEDDDCPICLEEYDYENPKMALQCSHDFHLACIYEWMERSQSCPVCAKVMVFNEGEEGQ